MRVKGAKPGLTTYKRSYAAGEPIEVLWENAPANRWDWLGVYKASAADPMVDSYLIWQYMGGAASGTMAGPPAGALALDDTAWGELHGDDVMAGRRRDRVAPVTGRTFVLDGGLKG